jgi:hypothetical protein
MRTVLRTAVSVAAGAMVLAGARVALASGGVVFIHGTGDHQGTLACSGGNCAVSAAVTGYWTQSEITSIANGRPYVVTGFAGGACAPWPNGTTYGLGSGGTGSATDPYWDNSTCTTTSNNITYTVNGGASQTLSLTGASGHGYIMSNADIVAAQIVEFLAYNPNVTELTLVTHSGGSNQARFIMENYSRNSNYTQVHSLVKRVVAIAGPTDGTYLANEVFAGGVGNTLGGLLGYSGEGTNFIRTNYMTTYNSSSSYLGPVQNPVSGVNFYNTGGVSSTMCHGATVFGVCVGAKLPTLGGSSCDSYTDDLALLSLHDLYMNTNDSSTFRNSCSDGFISCTSSQALGKNFSFSTKQDHNQSHRQCNGLDVAVRGYTTGNGLTGFEDDDLNAGQVPPTQIDACGFSIPAAVDNSSGSATGYTEGCPAASLGDGVCNADCIALYGHDAKPTWSGAAGKSTVTAWGSSDDCENSSNNTSSTYNGTTYLAASQSIWGESNQSQTSYSVNYINTYLNSSGNAYYTTYNGLACDSNTACQNWYCGSASGSTTSTWYVDNNYGTTWSAGYCPPSWFNDGYCDECMLAVAGSDGTDCLPGHVTWCGGIESQNEPLDYQLQNGKTPNCSNPVTNEAPVKGSSCTSNSQCSSGSTCVGGYCTQYWGWGPIAASAGDGICESSECGASVTFTGTNDCNSNSDCPSGYTCSNGGCTNSASDCTATYNLPPRTCATNADCEGNSCQGGTCSITGGTCTVPSGATSTCNGSGVCSCTTSADCSGGAACNGGTCATSVTASLCR